MKPVGKPDALIGHVRFDERGWETGRRSVRQCSRPSSTLQKCIPGGMGALSLDLIVDCAGLVQAYAWDEGHALLDPPRSDLQTDSLEENSTRQHPKGKAGPSQVDAM